MAGTSGGQDADFGARGDAPGALLMWGAIVAAAKSAFQRKLIFASAIVCAVIAVLVVVATVKIIDEERRQETVVNENTIWMGHQLQIEAYRFYVTLEKYIGRTVPIDEVALRLDLLFSRLDALRTGDVARFVQADRATAEIYGRITAKIADIEQIVDRLALEPAAATDARAAMEELRDLVQQFDLAILKLATERATGDRRHAIDLLLQLSALMVALAIGISILVGSLWYQFRNESRIRRRMEDLADSLSRARSELAAHAENLEVLVADRTAELRAKSTSLEIANTKLLSSINYALRIQTALLPPRAMLSDMFADADVAWAPRDIVGGDFYWACRRPDADFMIIADCTGHGVPGALMTMIVAALLDGMKANGEAFTPSVVLGELNRRVKAVLGQNDREGTSNDGLDCVALAIDRPGRRMAIAGARLAVWRCREDGIAEIRGARASVGYRDVAGDTVYPETVIDLVPGDRFFVATDGFFDQIGGPRRLMFGTRRFREALAGLPAGDMASQCRALQAIFEAYRGREERRDDLLLFGFRPL